ncbi:MAG: hypothetical protein IAC06_09130 [Bacteroidetes bacterium]|uniref:ATPase n=1 Tax=Candidatus Cryptobacteroides intestinavium TaxID=2840766 RepID=A0A9D9EW50_9BACT|nr:hypothetical protein [Candidatus Cryptobacteroides intestinavium]
MDIPFVYDRYVTNKDFAGRKSECLALTNLLSAGEHIVLSEPPKSGKKSLIQQAFFVMRLGGKIINAAVLDMFNLRSTEELLTRFGSTVIRSVSSSPDEYEDIVSRHLAGTHFVFDRERFAVSDEIVSLNWSPDMADMEAIFSLPFKIAEESGQALAVVLDEFQTILSVPEHETIIEAMESVFKARGKGTGCSYILSGSKVNAMKYIFRHRKYFYRMVEHLPLLQISENDIIEHIRKGYLKGGKEIDKSLAIGVCRLFKGNIWYINHFSAICDSMSKGYINEGIMMDALKSLTSIHSPRFMAMVDSLTEHQIKFLRAVLDGITRFSSTDVIEKYRLNSSANVKRVKDALMKKEILTFNENDEPVILDPLFEYWVRKYYFEIS